MKKLRFVRTVLVLLGLALLLQGQTIQYAYQLPLTIYTTVTTGGGFRISGTSAAFHVLTWNNVGTVATCQVQVDGSVDGITWGNGDVIPSTLCTTSGTVTSTSHVVNFIRTNMTAISGAGATVSVRLTGYVTNPTGGGGGGTVTNTGGALTAGLPMIGAGGNDSAVGTKTGNTTQFASWTGATTASRCVHTDASGNLNVAASDCSTATGTVTNTGGALTANSIVLGAGTNDTKVIAGLTTDGTGAITDTTGGTALTHTQGTITTSNPSYSNTTTWNAAGVAFTQWLQNVTCTAAATGSIVAGWGVGGTAWQLKYNGATCTNPQMVAPNSTTANPAFSSAVGVSYGFGVTSGGITFLDRNGVGLLALTSASNVNIGAGGASSLCWVGSSDAVAGTADNCISRGAAAGLMDFGTAAAGKTAFIRTGMDVFVASNFTTAANTNLQTITGLSWTMPAVASNWRITCDLSYSQATAAASVAFGIQAATNAPTNIYGTGTQQITVGPPATFTTGTLATLTTTTATAIVSGTPGAQATNYNVHLAALVELPASANTINIMVSTATSGDAVTVLRGSSCALQP
jgi:hypothetical protein